MHQGDNKQRKRRGKEFQKTKGKIGKEQKGVKRKQKRERGGDKKMKRIRVFNRDFF